MPLLEELIEVAMTLGMPLERLSTGRDRYGPVEALLFAHGHLSVRSSCDHHGYEVLIWHGELIVAKGRTSDVEEIATTMAGQQDGLPVRDLCRRHGYLDPVDPADGIEAIWHLLVEHGEEYLRPLVVAVTGNPTLRGMRPWVSHGTLHLLHRRDDIDAARYGVAFHPTENEMFTLNVYDGLLGPAETLAAVVSRAATAAKSW